jgi:GNAT superfamily N-acetyltransferase
MAERLATAHEAERITETISTAFHHDPVWGWAFDDADLRQVHYARWWRLFVEAGLRNEGVWVTSECEAATVWIPPGCVELSPDEEVRLEPMLRELVGSRTELFLEVFDRFEAAHPRDEPHYYLSLLATHDDHRGRGLGVGLLAENLQRIDSEHMPAYLESTNPANLERYERHGFVRHGSFTLPEDGPVVTTMRRGAR